MTRPTFSVIVTSYNRPALLREALASVLAQTRPDFECIVVDDASPTPPVVPSDPRFKLVRRACNGGPAASRNTGLEHATGQYITFLDDDDLFVPERLELALGGLARAPIALCWSRFVDRTVRRRLMLRGNVHDVILNQGVPSLGATTLRAECVLQFDERFFAVQDADWWLRISRDIPVWTTERFGYLVRKHPGVRHRNDAPARIRGSLLLLEKHAAYFSAHPRAAAAWWTRAGILARRLGDYALARRALAKAFRRRPTLRTLSRLIRSLRPSTRRLSLEALGLWSSLSALALNLDSASSIIAINC
ncbi:MAG TPA: glycosyltransferase family 2 protein [Gemmatimonadales bacterium]|nr:glycosyltransferase family 2 protein [Gemmatimonadales bacterium]